MKIIFMLINETKNWQKAFYENVLVAQIKNKHTNGWIMVLLTQATITALDKVGGMQLAEALGEIECGQLEEK